MSSALSSRSVPLGLVIITLFFSAATATAAVNRTAPENMGFVEWVVLEDAGLRTKARLDTGAKTSSLHATDVEPFEKGEQEWVRFRLPLDDHNDIDSPENQGIVLEFERPVERTVLIKRKGAPSQRRYVVNMEFCIAGSIHETQFSLTDRGAFTYAVLLGRRFMGKDNVLVDSADSFLADAECKYNSPAKISELPAASR